MNESAERKSNREKRGLTGHSSIDPSDVGEEGYLCEFYRKRGGFDHLVLENL